MLNIAILTAAVENVGTSRLQGKFVYCSSMLPQPSCINATALQDLSNPHLEDARNAVLSRNNHSVLGIPKILGSHF